MTVREMLDRLLDHAADGRTLNDDVVIKMNGTTFHIDTSYSDGQFILIPGPSLP